LVQIGVQSDYFIKLWFFAGVCYYNYINRTEADCSTLAPTSSGLDYTKHLILGRVGITY
jgi:hypothetical protein